MADMTLKWEAHDKNVVAELEKINKQMESLREQNRKLSEESKRHHDEHQSFLGEQIHSLGEMALGYLSIEKAIDVVGEAYEGWKEQLKDFGQEHSSFMQKLMTDLTAAGDAARAKDVLHFLHEGPGTHEQRRQVLAGVTAAAPNESLERRMELANEASKQAATGINMGEYGGMLGNLARFAPTKSGGDISDISLLLMQQLRGGAGRLNDDAFLRGVSPLISSGAMDMEEALGLGASAVSKNQKTNFLTDLAQAVGASKEDLTGDIKPGVALSDQQKGRQRLAKLGSRERYEALMGDHDLAAAVLGKESAYQLGRHTLAGVEGWRKMIADAEHENIGGQIAGADSEVGRAALAEQAVAEQKAENEARVGQPQSVIERARQAALQAKYKEDGYFGYSLEQISQKGTSFAKFIGLSSNESEMRKYAENRGGGYGGLPQEVINELVEALKENTAATKRNTPSGATGVDSHNEHGQSN